MVYRSALLLAGIILSSPLQATTINVTTTVDELTVNGQCSLREAIKASNTNSAVDSCGAGLGYDTIILPAGTYTLTLTGTDVDDGVDSVFSAGEDAYGDLDITEIVTINGAGAGNTVIDGNQADRIFQVHLYDGLTLDGVTLQNGNNLSQSDWGGCLRANYATVSISNSIIDNCQSALDGGALYSKNSSVTLTNVEIMNSIARDRGAGIAHYSGSLTIGDSSFHDNLTQGFGGGAIYISGYYSSTPVGITGTSIDNNTARNGAVYVYGSGSDVNIANSSLTNNTATAQGGAFYLTSNAKVTVTNSTISNNTSTWGGAAYLDSLSGGYGYLHLINSTVTGNSDSAISGLSVYATTLLLRNTIIANNIGDYYPNIVGSYGSEGYNLIDKFVGTVDGTDTVGVDPLLGTATTAPNGILYYPLLPGSPAIDGGNPAGCLDAYDQAIAADQTGGARSVDGDNDTIVRCDIGAIEQPFAYGLVMSPVSQLFTSEQGNSTTVNMQLNSAPQNDVTVALSVSDNNEGQIDKNSLTFTSADWDTAQAVTLTGVDDAANDGETTYQLVTGTLSSVDPNFSGIDPVDLDVINTDDESAAVLVTRTDGSAITASTPLEIHEAGDNPSIFFQIKLASRPVADVTVYYTISDDSEATFFPYGIPQYTVINNVNYLKQTFTPDSWNLPFQMPIYAVNDLDDDGDITFTVDFLPAESTDLNYSGKTIPSIDVVTIDDDDPAPVNTSTGGSSGGGGGSLDLWLLAALLLATGISRRDNRSRHLN